VSTPSIAAIGSVCKGYSPCVKAPSRLCYFGQSGAAGPLSTYLSLQRILNSPISLISPTLVLLSASQRREPRTINDTVLSSTFARSKAVMNRWTQNVWDRALHHIRATASRCESIQVEDDQPAPTSVPLVVPRCLPPAPIIENDTSGSDDIDLDDNDSGLSNTRTRQSAYGAETGRRQLSLLEQLPAELLLELMLSASPASLFCLAQTCQRFAALMGSGCFKRYHWPKSIPKRMLQAWPERLAEPDYHELVTLIRRDRLCRTCKARYSVLEQLEMARYDPWLNELLHCTACAVDHPARYFSLAQRGEAAPEHRICIAHEGFVRLCRHKTFKWADLRDLCGRLPNLEGGGIVATSFGCDHASHDDLSRPEVTLDRSESGRECVTIQRDPNMLEEPWTRCWTHIFAHNFQSDRPTLTWYRALDADSYNFAEDDYREYFCRDRDCTNYGLRYKARRLKVWDVRVLMHESCEESCEESCLTGGAMAP